MARRKRGGDEELGGGANWMDTYGDMVTLLLTFFVLLFSFSTVDAAKWEALVGALTGSGSSAIPILEYADAVADPVVFEISSQMAIQKDSVSGETSGGNVELDLEVFVAFVERLEEFINENGLLAEVYPEPEILTVILRMKDSIFFDSGDATIKPEAYALLDDLAEFFAQNMAVIGTVNLEGHTDTDPIHTAMFTDNWDLSTKRATNAVRQILRNDGVDERKLTPIGRSEYHPVASNDTAAGKAENRRVDFVIKTIVSSEEGKAYGPLS